MRKMKKIPEFTNSFFRDNFLEEVKKRSPGSFVNNRIVIRDLMKEIPKPFQEFTMIDVQDYFINDIDKREIKKVSKNTKRYMLMSFFNYIQKTLLAYGIEFSNPIPSKKIFKFSTNLEDISHVSDDELKILTLEQIKKILAHVYHDFKLRDFILVGLAICSGARISEIRTIMKKDIDLETHSFQTGFMLGARKTTLHTNKGLLFFFPSGFTKYIQEYLESCNKCEKYLFPGYKDNCLSRPQTQNILVRIREKVGFHFTWHYFRRTLISERIKKGCPKWLSEGLTNHAPSDVQAKSYIKLKFSEKKEFYNQYFPYFPISYFK